MEHLLMRSKQDQIDIAIRREGRLIKCYDHGVVIFNTLAVSDF